ncbi:hypothetical protein [Salinibacterium sp. ZJ450]|uniref:hypothetical protein n=1 Tax=Salinibacterium sp. ZJ450 TaxID=2708338 RepID=UPI0014232A1A|nr:hypothetical protein [Salinibacterium sp. ZJ450]
MRGDALLISPHDADPLSWFSSRYLPIAFGGVALSLGAVTIIASWPHSKPVPQLIAFLCFAVAFPLIGRLTAPHRTGFRLRHAIVPLLLSWVGVGLSAIGYARGTMPVEHWWAPIAAACVLMALITRSSALKLSCYALASTVVCALATGLVWHGELDPWPPLSIALIAGITPLMGGIAAAVYSGYMVSHTLVARDAAAPGHGTRSGVQEHATAVLRNGRISAVAETVSAFLLRIARRAEVGDDDRAEAAALADRVRSVLVARVQSTWLDDLAAEHELTVLDPNGRAERMTAPQRAVVRGILSTVLGSPMLEPGTLRISLRGQPDDATAVDVRMKLTMPEARRVRLLAPYYLTLQTVARDLHWEAGEQLRVRFQLPATPRQSLLQQTYLPE